MDLHGWSQEPDGDYEAVFFVQEVKTLMLPPAAALWSFCRKNWIQNSWPNCYWALLKVTLWLAWPHGPLPQSSRFVSGNRISVDMWLVGCILGGWCWLRSHCFLGRWKLIRSIRCLWTWRPPVKKLRLAAKRPPWSPEDDLHQAPLWHPPFWPGLPPVTCFPGCRVNLEDCFKLNISMRCPYPSPPWWLPDDPVWPANSKQQSEGWHQPEVPLRKPGAVRGWATATRNQGASAAGLSFTLKFWGLEWTPGRPREYQLMRPRHDQRLVLQTDPDPVLNEHTWCLSMLPQVGIIESWTAGLVWFSTFHFYFILACKSVS